MLKRILILAGALLMAAGVSLAHAGDAAPTLTRLENGLGVLVQPDKRFPLVSLRLYVHAGSAYETPGRSGISHLLEHMVFKGTARRAPGQVAEDIESAGGYLNAATSFDYTVYIIDLPAERLDLGLDVLRDMIFGAALDPEELEREKQVVLSELERGEDSPGSRRFQALQPLLWPGTPYERPIIGLRETVSSFTRQDILDYIAEFYQPQSMLAVVVGDVDPARAVDMVRAHFGDLKNTAPTAPRGPLPAPRFDAPRVAVQAGPWNKVYLSVAFPAPALGTAQGPGLDLLAQVLGGDRSSRLYRKYQYELGLVDSISAYAMNLEGTGLFSISAELDRDKLPAFWAGLTADLAALPTTAFTDRELDRARLNLEDDLYSSKETLGGLASKLGYFQFFENGPQAEDNYLYALRHAGADELRALAAGVLTREALAATVLLPEGETNAPEALEKDLLAGVDAAFGPGAAAAPKAEAVGGQRGGMDTVDLGGGRTLVLLPDTTLPYTSVTLAAPGGDALLFPDEQGLAELAAQALTRGTADLSATEYRDFLADRAASIGARASRDMFTVSARFPSRFAADVLPLLGRTITAPAFGADEVARAVTEQQAAIRSREDQPTGLAFRHLFPMLFADTGYGQFHEGTVDGIAGLGPAQVREFWARQRRQPWTMAVCGDFDREAVVALARELAAGPPAEPFAFPRPTWGPGHTQALTLPDRNQSHIVVAFPVPGLRSDDSVGLDVLRQALAGQGGLLFRELRDRQGLGYTVTALLWQAPETGFLAFYIGTSPDKTAQALEGFRQAVTGLRETPLAEAEVARAASLIAGDYHRDNQSLSARSAEAAGLLARGFPADHDRENVARAAQVTPADLHALARNWLVWDRAYVLTVEP
jgi:zinc protease